MNQGNGWEIRNCATILMNFATFLEESYTMIQRGLVCLLLAGMTWAQTPNTTTAPATAPSPAAAQTDKAPAAQAAEVPPDAPVITIQGLCDGADKTAADCKTVITRADFEHLVDTVAPKLPPPARKQFANRYANALIMSKEAEKEGLDKTPKFDEMMKLTRMQLLQQALGQSVQEKAAQVPDKDIEDYYKANQPAFEQFHLVKLYVPRHKEPLPGGPKLSDDAQKKRDEVGEAAMKKLAESLRTRLAAGEDADKLEKEAYTAARNKMTPPTTKLDNIRHNMLPPDQAPVFDLKAGEVSKVMEDENGFIIFKMLSKEELPLEKVHDEIRNTLRSQRIQEGMQAAQKSATATLNDAYFSVPGAAPVPGMKMPMGGPGGMQMQMAPPPVKK